MTSHPKKPLAYWQSLPVCFPQFLAIADLLYVSMDLPVLDISTDGIIHFMTFCVWLLSLSIMFLRFIQIVVCISALFLFMGQIIFHGVNV